MTDNEIIKALECCIKSSHFGECFENKCPLVSEKGCMVGKETLYPYALDLINRQKAEIERLKDHNKQLRYDRKQITSEAIKDFAVRLKSRFMYDRVINNAIDNLVKEMAGENDET